MDNMTLRQISKPNRTQIHFGHGILYSPLWLQILKSFKGPLVIISDEVVQVLLVNQWVQFLKKEKISTLQLSFPTGERSKTREMKALLEDQLLSQACGKDTVLIAIGGGVTTDLVGYLASTFCRGVALCCIPTTLLCMVDAVIGGKTGVNTSFGKNLIGTFYPAEHVLIDTSLLKTLPEREWRNGLAEVIKYALIRSPSLFETLKTGLSLWEQKDPTFLKAIIKESCLIKKEIVETDFQETGYRRILNFGHTIAHAIERLSDYQMPHGEAVALGMLGEMELSHCLGGPSLEACEDLKAMLKNYAFPLEFPPCITEEQVIHAMQWDKKALCAIPRFVLLQEVGRTQSFDGAYCTRVDEVVLKNVLSKMISYAQAFP